MLAAAVESPISLACSRTSTLLVLAQGRHVQAATRLAEMFAHAPEMSAAVELDAHARLALVAAEDSRAELLATAAAGASNDPAATWLGLARFANRTGRRDLELMALKRTILHTEGLAHGSARRQMVLIALQDLQRGWAESKTAVGRESVARHVDAYLGWFPAPQRHAQRRELARRLAEAEWVEESTRGLLVETVLGDPSQRAQMQREIAALQGSEPAPIRGELDVAGMAANVGSGVVSEVPGTLQVLADPVVVLELVRALARGGRAWIPRWRASVGLAVLGDSRQRVEGLLSLRELIADDARRQRRLVELVAGEPGALEPDLTATGPRWRSATLIDEPETLFAFAFGLDPSPALVAR
jgi:hypothetical protein